MEMGSSLEKKLKQRAFELGFNMAGIIEARPSPRLWAYQRWLSNTFHGQMEYMARPDRILRREDLNVILPGVKSIVCVGFDYSPKDVPVEITSDPSRGRISNYAWGLDYHDLMAPRLDELAGWLRSQSTAEVENQVYVDTGAILERDHGELAGLGFRGKNTMLIQSRGGSYFFLGELLTTAVLEPDVMGKLMPSCGSCRRCLAACPTEAFPEPYVLDARRCISYLTIELKGWIPRDLRPMMVNWVYGCDICQEVCPFNRFSMPSQEESFHPAGWDAVAPPLLELLSLDERGFDLRFANSPIKRIKRRRLVRNACVAAGNWGDRAAVPMLIQLLDDREYLVRGHAAWALGQIGGIEAEIALKGAIENEFNSQVREELDHVLAKTSF